MTDEQLHQGEIDYFLNCIIKNVKERTILEYKLKEQPDSLYYQKEIKKRTALILSNKAKISKVIRNIYIKIV